MTLRSQDGETRLQIALSTTTGAFSFYVPGVGFFEGDIPLRYSGHQIVHTFGSANARFLPLEDGVGTSTMIRMEGEINRLHKTASLNVWVGHNKKYRLIVEMPSAARAKQAAEENAQVMVTRDWPRLYTALSSDQTTHLTLEEFESEMSATPRVVAATVQGDGKLYEFKGHQFYAIDVGIAVSEADGETSKFTATEFLILENGEWRLLSTTTPKPL